MAKQLSGEVEVETEAKTEVKEKDESLVNGEDGVEVETEVKAEAVFETEVKAEVQAVVEAKFTKEQLLNCKKYIGSKDILTALLTEGESYTHAQVSKLTEDFMKGEIR